MNNETNDQLVSKIKIGQLNLGNSRAACDEARHTLCDLDLDIFLLQEPYSIGGTVRCFGMGAIHQILGNHADGNRPMAAIVVKPEMNPLSMVQHSNTHFTVMQINSPIGPIAIISSYFQYAHPIAPYITKLENILNALKGKHIIFCGDVNATSTLWHANIADDKGEELEELIYRHQLAVVNEDLGVGTHKSGRKIDLTLCTTSLVGRIKNWQIWPDATISDHNLITFDVTFGDTTAEQDIKPRFKPEKVQWTRFNDQLERRLREQPLTPGNMTQALKTVVEDFTPKATGNRTRVVPWWTEDLTNQKKVVKRARRAFQSCCPCRIKLVRQGQFRRERNKYKAMIQKAKVAKWETFVKETANKDPLGFVYKLAAKKLKIKDVPTCLKIGNNQYTESTKETLQLLLDELIPDENEEAEEDCHKEVRERKRFMMEQMDGRPREDPFSMVELKEVMRKLKKNKAPGPDGIPSEVIKNLNEDNLERLLAVYNSCWEKGEFPQEWKHARLVIIRKAGERDWSDPTSYRPISLLSVLGKTYERLVVNRIEPILGEKLSPNQYGFVSGKSAEDAIQALMNWCDNVTAPYAVALFADIKGAFDRVWRPYIIVSFAEMGLKWNSLKTLDSYLQDRTVEVEKGGEKCQKRSERGSPQGSVFGPKMWNASSDKVLRQPLPEGALAIGFADDKVILIQGRSRKDLEDKFAVVTEWMERWAIETKLEFSSTKTQALMLKGKFDRERPPRIFLGGRRINFVDEVSYLGVMLDRTRSMIPHAKSVSGKAKATMGRLNRLAKVNYGVSNKSQEKVYRMVVVPMLTYGSRIIAHRMDVEYVRKHLRAAQRLILIGMTGAYRSTSFAAITTMTSTPPIDLEVKRRRLLWEIRAGMHQLTKREMEQGLLDQWQRDWTQGETGRLTHEILPGVLDRLQLSKLVLNQDTCQFLTGHGKFGTYLYRRTIKEHEMCEDCGEVETPQHVLIECGRWEPQRRVLKERMQRVNVAWPPAYKELFTNMKIVEVTMEVCSEILRIKREEEAAIP